MTDSNYTHILAIVDRSGSMSVCAKEMTDALNEYFSGQSEVEGKCLVDYVQFDTVYKKVYSDQPVSMAEAVIQPRGGTALIDAIGRGTKELGRKLKALPEAHRPGKVLVVVVTDGYENSSHQYTAEQVKEMVTTQQDVWKWDYVFLGANIDAVEVGAWYGFQADKSLTFDTANAGLTMASLGGYTTNYRGAAGAAAAFTDEDRKKAVDSDQSV